MAVKTYWLERTEETVTEKWPDGSASTQHLYVDSRTGAKVTLDQAEPGAVWNAHWIAELVTPDKMTAFGSGHPDGRRLCVKLPGGSTWDIDSKASNCTRPTEPHRCWCRHGDPTKGELHVDKNPESGQTTCAAGAGSIRSGDLHGHLHKGFLVPCPDSRPQF